MSLEWQNRRGEQQLDRVEETRVAGRRRAERKRRCLESGSKENIREI